MVQVDGFIPESRLETGGTIEGNPLDPLLFSFYVTDFLDVVWNNKLFLFAQASTSLALFLLKPCSPL